MSATEERVTPPPGALTAHSARSATAVIVAALALAAPQWAAAQEMSDEAQEALEAETQQAEESIEAEAEEAQQNIEAESQQAEESIEAQSEQFEQGLDLDAQTVPPEGVATGEGGALDPAPAPSPRPEQGVGAALAAGAGVSDFSRSSARDFVDTGGSWELRGVFGTRSLIGVEAAYIGSAYGIDAPGESTTLFSNGAEVSGRLNLLRNGMDDRDAGLQPYALAGVAWKNYQLSGDLETAAVDDEDNAFEVPLGVGLAYYFENGIMLDGRFAYRFAFEDELIQPVGEDEANLDNWNATARLGVEF